MDQADSFRIIRWCCSLSIDLVNLIPVMTITKIILIPVNDALLIINRGSPLSLEAIYILSNNHESGRYPHASVPSYAQAYRPLSQACQHDGVVPVGR